MLKVFENKITRIIKWIINLENNKKVIIISINARNMPKLKKKNF